MNVDNLKIIQVGVTLANDLGEFPDDFSTWQFNFKFNAERDPHLIESINLLEEAGIDFNRFFNEGIDMEYFGELFTTSGLVLNENVKWITFHGSYDFAYLIKILSNQQLPEDENPFNDVLSLYFPVFYDVRQMIKNLTWLKGSLSKISHDLDIKRIGNTHQAGSDSYVTSKVFFKLISNFQDQLDLYGDKNKLFGFSYKNDDEYMNNYNNFAHFNNYVPGLNMNSNKMMGKNNNMNNNLNNMMYMQNMQNVGMPNNNNSFINMNMNPMMYANFNNAGNYNNMYQHNDYNNFYPQNYYPSNTKTNK